MFVGTITQTRKENYIMARSLNLKLSIFLMGAILLSNTLSARTFMGEYEGTFYPDKKFKMDATADVVVEGDGNYRIVIDAKSKGPAQEGAFIEIYGKRTGETVTIKDRTGGYEWKGEIKDGKLHVRGHYGLRFELKKIESKSPRAGAKPPPNAVILLPYEAGKKPDMSGWTNSNWLALDNGSMQIVKGKGSNRTRQQFSDIKSSSNCRWNRRGVVRAGPTAGCIYSTRMKCRCWIRSGLCILPATAGGFTTLPAPW
jgi:hypothetical protein